MDSPYHRSKDKATKSSPQGLLQVKEILHTFDVVLGRGNGVAQHYGNANFRDLVDRHQYVYQNIATRSEKLNISRRIVTLIYQSGGEFVCPLKKKGQEQQDDSEPVRFSPITVKQAILKTSQALRELRKSPKRSDKIREAMMQRPALFEAPPTIFRERQTKMALSSHKTVTASESKTPIAKCVEATKKKDGIEVNSKIKRKISAAEWDHAIMGQPSSKAVPTTVRLPRHSRNTRAAAVQAMEGTQNVVQGGDDNKMMTNADPSKSTSKSTNKNQLLSLENANKKWFASSSNVRVHPRALPVKKRKLRSPPRPKHYGSSTVPIQPRVADKSDPPSNTTMVNKNWMTSHEKPSVPSEVFLRKETELTVSQLAMTNHHVVWHEQPTGRAAKVISKTHPEESGRSSSADNHGHMDDIEDATRSSEVLNTQPFRWNVAPNLRPKPPTVAVPIVGTKASSSVRIGSDLSSYETYDGGSPESGITSHDETSTQDNSSIQIDSPAASSEDNCDMPQQPSRVLPMSSSTIGSRVGLFARPSPSSVQSYTSSIVAAARTEHEDSGSKQSSVSAQKSDKGHKGWTDDQSSMNELLPTAAAAAALHGSASTTQSIMSPPIPVLPNGSGWSNRDNDGGFAKSAIYEQSDEMTFRTLHSSFSSSEPHSSAPTFNTPNSIEIFQNDPNEHMSNLSTPISPFSRMKITKNQIQGQQIRRSSFCHGCPFGTKPEDCLCPRPFRESPSPTAQSNIPSCNGRRVYQYRKLMAADPLRIPSPSVAFSPIEGSIVFQSPASDISAKKDYYRHREASPAPSTMFASVIKSSTTKAVTRRNLFHDATTSTPSSDAPTVMDDSITGMSQSNFASWTPSPMVTTDTPSTHKHERWKHSGIDTLLEAAKSSKILNFDNVETPSKMQQKPQSAMKRQCRFSPAGRSNSTTPESSTIAPNQEHHFRPTPRRVSDVTVHPTVPSIMGPPRDLKQCLTNDKAFSFQGRDSSTPLYKSTVGENAASASYEDASDACSLRNMEYVREMIPNSTARHPDHATHKTSRRVSY